MCGNPPLLKGHERRSAQLHLRQTELQAEVCVELWGWLSGLLCYLIAPCSWQVSTTLSFSFFTFKIKTRRPSTSERSLRVIKSIVHLVLKRWLHCSTWGITCAAGGKTPPRGHLLSACVVSFSSLMVMSLAGNVKCSTLAFTHSGPSHILPPPGTLGRPSWFLESQVAPQQQALGDSEDQGLFLQDLRVHSAAGAGGRGRGEEEGREKGERDQPLSGSEGGASRASPVPSLWVTLKHPRGTWGLKGEVGHLDFLKVLLQEGGLFLTWWQPVAVSSGAGCLF